MSSSWCPYCAEISKYNNDISVITSMQKTFQRMVDRNSSKNSALKSLSGSVIATISPANPSGLTGEINDFNKDTAKKIGDFMAAASDELASLKSKLATAKANDRKYHAEHGY
ncbi:MAG: hypothetical protein FWF45_02065 [Coriobacteriia bacterium]|nr:hypothetical protein [Coriobacteriia bacterium]